MGCCCGAWCCKGALELMDPNCCYCFESTALGCNLFCCGISCPHPVWSTPYVRQQLRTALSPYSNPRS